MSNVLHMLPVGAAWLQWDSARGGQLKVDVLSRDNCHTVIIGPDASGKTSLAFQAAVTMATDNKHVTFVRPKVLSRLPLPVHGMPTPEASALQQVKFWYPEQAEEVVKWCGNMHTQVVLSDVIIIDDFHFFAAQGKNVEHSAARMLAALVDAVSWIRSKSGQCRLIVTSSHRLSFMAAVSRQFQMGAVYLTDSAEGGSGDGSSAWKLTSATPMYSLSASYSLAQHNIVLLTVDIKTIAS